MPQSERRDECAVLPQRQASCSLHSCGLGWHWGVACRPPQGCWEPTGLQTHQLFNKKRPLGLRREWRELRQDGCQLPGLSSWKGSQVLESSSWVVKLDLLDPLLHILSTFRAERKVQERARPDGHLSPGRLLSLFSTAPPPFQEFQKCRGHDLVCGFCINYLIQMYFLSTCYGPGTFIHSFIQLIYYGPSQGAGLSLVKFSPGLTPGVLQHWVGQEEGRVGEAVGKLVYSC